ncbi:PaaI family thioesterase [Methanobacterium aggregans]|uniref:PaaI family thioesterase n=1 Tax=Methanobacterium aggregans TaxID=1615586 RepID=UPI001FD926F1|nr:PaaI family thioesterase [Methanobacterium aggregans]MBP2046955.1 acyl-CoA thioesterase [Methanobacterium aggregans]
MDEDLKRFFKRDRFAEFLGIELLEAGEGYARSRMEIGNDHFNGIGTVHGGAIFTLADFTFAVASNSHGKVSVAINADVSFMNAARGGALTAEAREISRNHKLGSYTVEIRDDTGELVAIFQGLAYIKKKEIEFSK